MWENQLELRYKVALWFWTHHEMRLCQYPPEFLRFVVLGVAGDFLQHLRTRRVREKWKHLHQFDFSETRCLLLTAEMAPLVPAAPQDGVCMTQKNLGTPRLLHTTANVSLTCRSWSLCAPHPPPLQPWLWGLMSAPVMYRLNGKCSIVEVRPLSVCECGLIMCVWFQCLNLSNFWLILELSVCKSLCRVNFSWRSLWSKWRSNALIEESHRVKVINVPVHTSLNTHPDKTKQLFTVRWWGWGNSLCLILNMINTEAEDELNELVALQRH